MSGTFFWVKLEFKDFIRYFRKIPKEKIAENILQSMDDLEVLNESGETFGSFLVRLAKNRKESKAAKASCENGAKGGRPKKNTDTPPAEHNNEVLFGKTELLPVQTKPKAEKPKVEKKKFGEFENVLLTDDEVSKLQSRCNTLQINFNDVVSRLSSYKAQKGTKYKSDYAAILNWVLNRCVEEKNKADGRKSFQQIERERQAQFVGSLLDDDVKREYGIGGF